MISYKDKRFEHYLSLSKLCKIMMMIALLNFLLFMLFSSYLGGDAINGFQKNGEYYVSYGHTNTEVSRLLWILNTIHFFSVIITHLAAMCCPVFSKPKNIPYKKLY